MSHAQGNDLVKSDSNQDQPVESAQSNKADTNDIAELLTKLFEDLYSVPYHPTDLDACGLHEKHTPQCYACRHAKWSNIIKAELRERFDRLNALQELKKWAAQETNKARIDPYDFVEPCQPDCSPERHAYHQGQWDMATRMESQLTADKEQADG